MYCAKCGSQVPEGNPFCPACGAPVASESTNLPGSAPTPYQGPPNQPPYPAPPPPYQGSPNQPPYPGPPPPYQGPMNQPPYPGSPPRKKGGCAGCLIVFLILLLIVAGGLFYLFGSLSLFKPKDLGVRYDSREFQQAMEKTGVEIDAVLREEDLGKRKSEFLKAGATETAEGDVAVDPSVVLELFDARGKTETLDPNDYTWEFSDYERKTFTMTGEEASAFFNEMAPGFWWFKDSQIKVEPDGTILTSSQVDIGGVLRFLFRDVEDDIPLPLPGKANLYTEGRIGIVDNQIRMAPDLIQIGPAKIPDEYMEEDVVEGVSMFLNRFITMIPGLQINRVEERNGSFDVDAIIPQKVTVRPKY